MQIHCRIANLQEAFLVPLSSNATYIPTGKFDISTEKYCMPVLDIPAPLEATTYPERLIFTPTLSIYQVNSQAAHISR
jgi:hypothetical protein